MPRGGEGWWVEGRGLRGSWHGEARVAESSSSSQAHARREVGKGEKELPRGRVGGLDGVAELCGECGGSVSLELSFASQEEGQTHEPRAEGVAIEGEAEEEEDEEVMEVMGEGLDMQRVGGRGIWEWRMRWGGFGL